MNERLLRACGFTPLTWEERMISVHAQIATLYSSWSTL